MENENGNNNNNNVDDANIDDNYMQLIHNNNAEPNTQAFLLNRMNHYQLFPHFHTPYVELRTHVAARLSSINLMPSQQYAQNFQHASANIYNDTLLRLFVFLLSRLFPHTTPNHFYFTLEQLHYERMATIIRDLAFDPYYALWALEPNVLNELNSLRLGSGYDRVNYQATYHSLQTALFSANMQNYPPIQFPERERNEPPPYHDGNPPPYDGHKPPIKKPRNQ